MRRMVSIVGLLVLLGGLSRVWAAAPQTGPVDPAFAEVDTLVQSYLVQRAFPGAVVVIGYADRIIYAQGYGHADAARQVPMSPWLESRLGSLSKPLTATAVMRLVQQGRVQLDAKAWDYVAATLGVEPVDPRLRQVTVRQLLTHTWGLDRSVSPDPMGIWYLDGSTLVSSMRDMLRFHLRRMQLDFAPGARYAYNNTGFAWLQLIAEVVDGRSLARQLTDLMGAEALSTGVVRIGEVLPSRLTDAEVRYHDYAGAPLLAPVPGVYPAPAPARVARQDGSYTLEGYGGSGGLVASPLTYVRFVQRLGGGRQPALLDAATLSQMLTEARLTDGTRLYYGLGIETWTAYTDADHVLGHTGGVIGARNAFRATPRHPNGPLLTVMVQTNGTPAGQGSEVVDNITAEIVDPIIFAVDRIAGYTAKPEITGDRLIAFGSATENYLADRLFDWGERQYPSLLPSHPASGKLEGYRYRYYPETGIYLGAKEGRVWLYQPSVSPTIQNLGAMIDFLPQATRDGAALAGHAPGPGARR